LTFFPKNSIKIDSLGVFPWKKNGYNLKDTSLNINYPTMAESGIMLKVIMGVSKNI
jgi:hypothetical protein